MITANFAYNEPGLGTIDIDGDPMSDDEMIKLIEEKYPEYVDIEILSTEEFI
jgi:hypothetical protein